MTGRERLIALLRGEPTDRLSWTVLVDDCTLGALPPELRGMTGVEFSRHLGCDIVQLEGWGTPHQCVSPSLEWGEDVATMGRAEGQQFIQQIRCPAGVLESVSQRGHPRKFLVSTLAELRVYRSLWEGARFVAHDDRPAFAALETLIGDDGIVTRFLAPSTIPRLLENDFGMQAFYFLLNDYPQEMTELIALMHEKELEAFRIAASGPGEVMILCENTSTTYISPDIYRRFNGPHVRDFVDIVHAAGKTAIIHMCGHVKQLLRQIKDTGLDGIHALTPPPTGDTLWELALDALGEDQIIMGVLDPTIFILGPVAGIGEALDHLYTPRLRASRFILWPPADGLTVPLERFEAVARWMESNGSQ